MVFSVSAGGAGWRRRARVSLASIACEGKEEEDEEEGK